VLIDYLIEECTVYLYRYTTKMEEIVTRLLAEMNVIREKMNDGQAEMKAQVGSFASRIDANQEETKSVAVHEIHTETFGGTKKETWGSASSSRAQPEAGETDAGQWRVQGEIGSRPQRDDPP
jgi:hypothetical protein